MHQKPGKILTPSIFLTAAFCLFLLAVYFQDSAKAGSSQNLAGFAWSENIGWISFNNISGGGSTNYGVNIDTSTGDLSGFAWSENIGWISFDRDRTGRPPGPPFRGASETIIAKYDSDTRQITGWARVISACKDDLWDGAKCTGDGAGNLSGGWDGWIKMSDASYGVSVNPACTLIGFAWGSDVIGWISFSGSNYSVKNTQLCTPDQPSLEDDGGSITIGPCTSIQGLGAVYLSWSYQDPNNVPQANYHLEVKRTSDNQLVVDTDAATCPAEGISGSAVSGKQGTSLLKIIKDPTSDVCDRDVNYGSDFTVRVKVKNNIGFWSAWSDWVGFSTPSHAAPFPNFTVSPATINVKQVVNFIDSSKCYYLSGTEYDCQTGGQIDYAWDLDYSPPFSSELTIKGNATTTFTVVGPRTIRLQITDNSFSPAIVCSSDKSVIVGAPLPLWKEISPTD